MKVCTNCGQQNADSTDVCSSCGYLLPAKTARTFRKRSESEQETISNQERYSFGPDEKEVAEYRPSAQILHYIERTSLTVGVFPALFAIMVEGSQFIRNPTLFNLGLVTVSFLIIWGLPAVFHFSFWRKLIRQSRYVVTTKRVIIDIARRSAKPRSIPLDDISYLRLTPFRGIYSNLIVVRGRRKRRDSENVPPGTVTDLSDDVTMGTINHGKSAKPRGRGRMTIQLVRNMRGSTMMYLSNEDALRAEETINGMLPEKS